MVVSRVLSCPLGALPRSLRGGLSGALACALFAAGCAHTGEGAAVAADGDEREVTVLRERVARLERRLSDLDAQVALLTQKVADAPRDSVSLGSPGYAPAPAPASYAPAPSSASWNGYAPAPAYDEEPAWQRNPATRSIDLGPAPPRSTTHELPPLEADDELGSGGDGSGANAALPNAALPNAASPNAASPNDVMPNDAVGQGPPRGDAQTVYDWAHARMKEGRYLEAIAAFEDVLERHAGHHLADNALYWTGSCHLERGEPRLAIEVWRTLPLRFPSSAKMADSLFGMALAHEELGEPVLAETLYAQLLQQYPKAEKGGEAKKALKRLRGSPDAPR